ncbi:hypothetical protein WHZ78_30925 [Bradyrhizobium symbiodeficiens]|uniref:hypothetical protein n=1 Tax=Bradyrhizobium symbiodeficiens TaxID=1404367 RepID=UPI0030CAEA2A
MLIAVIPGRRSAPNPESRGLARDSGFDAPHRPGMTTETAISPQNLPIPDLANRGKSG